jgi:CRP/FNR family transcriptional regulator, transcriptional activator FtrB
MEDALTDSSRVLVVAPDPHIYISLRQLAKPARLSFKWAASPSAIDGIVSSGMGFDTAILDVSPSLELGCLALADKIRQTISCGMVVMGDRPQLTIGDNDIYLQKPVKPSALIAAAGQVCARKIERVTPTRPRAALGMIEGLSHLSKGALDRIGLVTAIERVPGNQILFSENSRPTHLHAVVDGRVALTASTGCDSTVTEILGAGRPFILAAVLADTPYIQAARTLTDSTILRIEASPLRAEIGTDPQVCAAIIDSLSRHDRLLVRQLADLKLRSAAQRLGCFLLRLSREQRNAEKISLPCSKALLAAHLGMAPEHLSRAFVTLRSCGVATTGAVVSLGDLRTLERFARPDQDPCAGASCP